MSTTPATAEPVIVLVGPTASGKTSVAVQLAKRLGGEVVNADSRQVYRFLDVGTAKPTREEMDGVPHHGFDAVDPEQRYSAGRYAGEARRWIAEIRERGRWAIVAGGSGLYLQALVDGFFGGADVRDEESRAWLERRVEREGLGALHTELVRLDPEYAEKTLPGDRQRILRALEVIHASGEAFSDLHRRERNEMPWPARWFGLRWPREELYARIDRRVDEMLDRGLIAEVDDLLARGYREENALKSVGYEEIVAWREGRIASLDEAVERIKRNTRHYAKRQLTWFRRNERINWLDAAGRSAEELAAGMEHRVLVETRRRRERPAPE